MKEDKQKPNILNLTFDRIRTFIKLQSITSSDFTDDGVLRNDLLAKAFLTKQEEKN